MVSYIKHLSSLTFLTLQVHATLFVNYFWQGNKIVLIPAIYVSYGIDSHA